MYLYGASGHAKVIIDILKSQGKVLSGLIDDDESIAEFLKYTVYRFNTKLSPIIVSIGDNSKRKNLVEKLKDIVFETAIDTSAVISEDAKLDVGTVVMQGSIIQSGSVIGKHCIVNTGASIDHECKISDFVHISPHATLCGNVTVGEGTWIGAGATIIQGVTIGKWSVIGAGSVVINDIPDFVLGVGNKCKVIKNINYK